ncbi:MAG TPA: M1 family metallopeptidase [Kofleriaceae bacterium]|nr:M1 family metallopeptidase [Kofleriaceae bacterium]
MRVAPWAVCIVVACGPGHNAPVASSPPPVQPPAKPAPAETTPVADPTPPELRLPTTVKPLRHEVELTIDPATEDFSGRITIELDIAAATPVIWMHGHELTVTKATLGAQTPRVITAGKDWLGLVFAAPVPAGRATLALDYRGKQHKDDGTGIYTVLENNEWYAFTQFESTDAREAFPCFDEPSFKAPWKLAIRTKQNLTVVANTPAVGEQPEANGMKLVSFAETKPLPSYLVAFAIGPFEMVDAGKTKHGAPIRVIVPRGRTGDVGFAVTNTKPIVELLEDYFGTPYPYEKIDLIAVPVFNAGAMENPGLITFHQRLLVTRPAEMTLGKQKGLAVTIAHELAHMWFGDFVTLAWWDDTWLNESFASWMESKIVDQWKPEWEGAVSMVSSKSGVMGQDSLDSARAVRQPITTAGDINNAFDGITYQKGEAVLTMVERHIGADAFQKGVRDYLAKHAWGNATYDDFVASISAAAGKDLKPMFDAFVLQSGVPLVSFELSCKKGGPPTLAMSQRRYVPTGSQIDPKRTWQIPICVRWGAGAATGKDCMTLATETGELALTAKTCPDWVLPNEGELGYYRMLPKGDLLDRLLKKTKPLTLPERVGLLGDVNALVGSGDVKNGVALALVETLSKEKSRHIVDASIGIVAGIDEMVPDNLRPNYERMIKKLYRARALELGWQAKKGEDDNTKQMRPDLLSLVAENGRDKELIKQATALAWKWLDDHKAVDPELVGLVLSIAAHDGDQKLFDRLYADAKKATDRADRGRLLRALGSFADPKLSARAMQLSLSDDFELRESMGLLQGGFAERATREAAYKFVKDNYDAIEKKLPEPFRPYMAFTFVSLCDDSRKPEIEAFFKPRIDKLDGGPRIMAQALESLSLCSAARKAQTPGVVAFLKRQ